MNLREALQELYNRNGKLTASLVVDEARNPSDAVTQYLHDRLEWDDEIAGERYRLDQAAGLIRKVRVEYKPTPRSTIREVRAFVSVPDQDTGGRAYRPTDEVAADPLLAALMLREMEREWKQFKERYGHMQEFVTFIQSQVDDNGGAAAA